MQTGLNNCCPTCGAALKEYTFKFDVLDAVLLLRMAQAVREKYERSATILNVTRFTAANQVHVPDLTEVSLAVRCRTTQCSKLGLIAKLKGPNGRHVPGVWVITRRGWAALRGEPVPAEVRVYRNEITERPGAVITIGQALKVNSDKVAAAVARKKTPKNDYREIGATYQPEQWAQYERLSEPPAGELFN